MPLTINELLEKAEDQYSRQRYKESVMGQIS